MSKKSRCKSSSTEKDVSHPPAIDRQISSGSIRLRSGSTGHRILKKRKMTLRNTHQLSLLPKPQIVVDPRDIQIRETGPSGDIRDAGIDSSLGGMITADPSGDGMDFQDDERGGWGNKLDFLFSCISVSVGLGSMFNQYIYYINSFKV